ncbi:MAG: hypothetical protein J6Q84_03040 [Kiritimatiellae bacterium]|nr:hypothetical protein [Kiritimatiellia bacterium]
MKRRLQMGKVKRVKDAVCVALGAVYKNEFRLIQQQCHELNIVGAFYHYFRSMFERDFESYSIDMEYSRMGERKMSKSISVSAEKRKCSYCHEKHSRRVRSDFIIHKPGTDDNLVVIEFKGEWSKGCFAWDKKKLQELTKPLSSRSDTDDYVCGYQLGVSIVLNNQRVVMSFYPDNNDNANLNSEEISKDELIDRYESYLSRSVE